MGRVPVACGSFHSPSKPGKMSPYHTFVRGRCDDSAPYLLPAGDRGTPVALRHAALHVAKPRRSVTAATGAAGAPAVEGSCPSTVRANTRGLPGDRHRSTKA